MYGVLGVLLTVMGVSSALNDRLPWSRKVGRYKIQILPIAEAEYETFTDHMGYPSAVFESNPWRRSYRTNLNVQELITLIQEKNLSLTGPSTAQYQNYGGKEQSVRPAVPGALRRCVRTYGSWRSLSSPIRSFVNETFVKLHRRKRKKKRRKNAIYIPDSNLKINVSISNPKIISPSVKSPYVRATAARKNVFDCTCDPYEVTTKTKFILTPCECEADYEITVDPERNEICEGAPEEGISQEENLCDECLTKECETTCKVVEVEECCELDPIPKHTIDESRATLCQITQSSEEPEEDYPTYKIYPYSGCKHKKRPRPHCEHSEATVEKVIYEPDLRKIFSLPETTVSRKRAKPYNMSNKKKEKNSKNKIKRKYSKPKRKHSRFAHFKRKEVTTKYENIKSNQSESSKKYCVANILSKIKGRTNIEESTYIEEADNTPLTENTMEETEESENLGCNCKNEAQFTIEENENTETASSTITNDRVLDEMFKKFLGEAGKENIDMDKWVVTDSANKDESVTLIINVEDEVIAPPAAGQKPDVMNPLSVAVEEMLAEVKSKMTAALGTTTECKKETGIVTAERLKHVNHKKGTTVEAVLKGGLICTHCYKLNYPYSLGNKGEFINFKPKAETIDHDKTSETYHTPHSIEKHKTSTHHTSHSTEEHITSETTSEEDTAEKSYISDLGSDFSNIPVTDADYDQIISRIYCNFSEETTLDILKQLCQDNYGSTTPTVTKSFSDHKNGKTKVTLQNTFETYATQKTHHTLHQIQENSDGSDNKQTFASTKHHESIHLRDTTTHHHNKESTPPDFTKSNEGSETVQTICFPISDFIEPEAVTISRKTVKVSSVTNHQTEEEDTTPYPKEEDTTQHYDDTSHSPNEDDNLILPRLCNCTHPQKSTQAHHHNTHDHSFHKNTLFFHHHPSSSHHENTPSSPKDHPSTNTEMTESFETIVDTESEEPETHITTTSKITTNRPKKTSTKHYKDNRLIPQKDKEKGQKPSKFKFYPPLSLYRTWLSPWAAVQIKPRPSPYKLSQPNQYSYNNNNEQHIMSFPYQPLLASATDLQTTDPPINNFPSDPGHTTGVYIGAIIIGNKYLPPGFYKLEDLKKLKNSGIQIPKIRGKKTIVNDGVGYSLRRISSQKASNHDRRENKRKLTNNGYNLRNGGVIYSVAKLPKNRIGRTILNQILDSMKDTNSKTRVM